MRLSNVSRTRDGEETYPRALYPLCPVLPLALIIHRCLFAFWWSLVRSLCPNFENMRQSTFTARSSGRKKLYSIVSIVDNVAATAVGVLVSGFLCECVYASCCGGGDVLSDKFTASLQVHAIHALAITISQNESRRSNTISFPAQNNRSAQINSSYKNVCQGSL